MNGRKMLFDVMNEIDDDLLVINEGLSLLTKRTNGTIKMKWFVIGACSLLGVSICLWGILFKAPSRESIEQTISPSMDNSIISTAVEPSNNISETRKNMNSVRYSPTGQVGVAEFEPGQGEINMTPSLAEEIIKPENKDELFSISIDVIHIGYIDEYREKKHNEYLSVLNDPYMRKYEEEYEKWIQNIILPAIPDDEKAQFEEKVYKTQASYSQFDEYWERTQSEDVKKAYIEAKTLCEAAHDDYMYFVNNEEEIINKEFPDEMDRVLEEELARLTALGYNLRVANEPAYFYGWDCIRLTGCLTGEQLESFQSSPEHGYYIVWNREGGGVDE